tara:strand:- start:332 stop:460 length:129 start_codon:yes stop_codon:yes gene_type:complete
MLGSIVEFEKGHCKPMAFFIWFWSRAAFSVFTEGMVSGTVKV